MKKVLLDSLVQTLIDENLKKAEEASEKTKEAANTDIVEEDNPFTDAFDESTVEGKVSEDAEVTVENVEGKVFEDEDSIEAVEVVDAAIISEETETVEVVDPVITEEGEEFEPSVEVLDGEVTSDESTEVVEGTVESAPVPNGYDPFKGNNMIDMFQAMFGARSFRAPKKVEDTVIEEEEKDPLYEMDDEDDTVINSASIINLAITEKMLDNKSRKVVATLHWLCKSITDKLFVLTTSYLVEDAEEHEILLEIPFAENNKFVGARVSDNMMMSAIPNFITDMEFMIDGSKVDAKKDLYINAVRITNKGPKYCTRFKVSNELFASLKFADNYIMDLIVNNHDISLASVSAGKLDRTEENTTELFVVDRLDSIVAMAPIPTKKRFEQPEYFAVAFKGTRYLSKDETESATVMSVFNIDKKFKKSKFKGNTFEKLQDTYMKDFDRYTGSLIFMNRFRDYDKEFMCIKSKNKDGLTKIFMLDSDIREQLEKMINEY